MTTASWLAHFKLTHSPFSKDLDDSSLWLPTRRQEVVDDLVAERQLENRLATTRIPHPGCRC